MLQPDIRFLISSSSIHTFPAADKPEYAFAGRSNVGKSSLLNMIAANKRLAHTSQTPGKTQLINHFIADQSWYIADLPGYGYARVSKGTRKEFNRLIQNYVLSRTNLVCLFVLIDSRLEPQTIDLDFIYWLGVNQVPIALVFTKTDKLANQQLQRNIDHFKRVLLQGWTAIPPVFITSSVSRVGKEELLKYILHLNEQFKTG